MILHEEAEDGNAMPDLARPVQAVKLAVDNLIKVRFVSHIGLVCDRSIVTLWIKSET